jgi:hypothetical protein
MPIIETTKCAAVDCDECVTAGLEWFGADCHDNHCVAWDARAGDLSLCHSAGECRLRNGLDCCERCSSMNDTVAINASVESEWICREPCPPCPNGGPTYPRNLFAGCYDNHCLLFTRDL